MRLRIALATLAVLIGGLLQAPVVSANSLKLAPLEYRTTLKKGEKQKGFIDISNPTSSKIAVTVSVQAFRQIDDKGHLEFFDDEQITAGVKTDLKAFDLEPRAAMRMYFLLDGLKLPSGDVYGAIFFTAQPDKTSKGVNQRVQLGTLLSIVNGTPGPRTAEVKDLSVPLVHIGDEITGSYQLYNPADPQKSTGFYPQVTISSWPFGSEQKQTASLLFAGRMRESELKISDVGFGLRSVTVTSGDSSQSRWVLTITPTALVIIILITLVAAFEYGLYKRRHAKRSKKAKKIAK